MFMNYAIENCILFIVYILTVFDGQDKTYVDDSVVIFCVVKIVT